jgi:hypothetical protein
MFESAHLENMGVVLVALSAQQRDIIKLVDNSLQCGKHVWLVFVGATVKFVLF